MKSIIRLSLFLSVVLLCIQNTFAYNWLYVNDPQDWSISGQGSIDEATLKIQPKGVYMEYELSLTFSAAQHNFSALDTVEVNFSFTLPENTIVHDSWLLVEDEMVRAKHLDRWTAFQIYEGIVNRRRDPSVLYKNWGSNYELRVFPMRGDGTRKVKLNMLVPANWSGNGVTAVLPTDLLLASLAPTEKLTVIVKESEDFKNPDIPGYDELVFSTYFDLALGVSKKIDIPFEYFSYNLSLSFSNPLEKGVYLKTMDTGSEGLYQLVFNPARAFNVSVKRKVLVLFDFKSINSSHTNGNTIYHILKSVLYNNLYSGDYFNMFFSKNTIMKISPIWMQATPENINTVYTALGEKPVADVSNLDDLIFEAVDFIKDNHGEGEILLLTNSSEYSELSKSNELMESLKSIGNLPEINIIDFYDVWDSWFCWENYCYSGNEYLYKMLSRYTGGNYYKYNYWDNTVIDILTTAIYDIGNYADAFDLHTSLESGFCHSRFQLQKSAAVKNINAPVVEIGKYSGYLPFKIEAYASIGDKILSFNEDYTQSETGTNDTLLEEMWAGNYIESLSNDWSYDNSVVEKILEVSLEERVLSNYTAFLTLEPGMEDLIEDPVDPQNPSSGGEVFLDANDNVREWATSIDEESTSISDKVKLRALPNPFYNYVQIQINVPDEVDWRKLVVELYDLNGRKIKEFDPSELIYNGIVNIQWDGNLENGERLPANIYVLSVSGDGFKKSIKIFKAEE